MKAAAANRVQRGSNKVVTFKNHQGFEVESALVRITRYFAAFEVYHPHITLQLSEVLHDFVITVSGNPMFSGRATVTNLVNTGSGVLCEVTLDEEGFTFPGMRDPQHLNIGEEFEQFIQEWQQFYRVRPDYKLLVADLQAFLIDVRLWLQQLELNLRGPQDSVAEEVGKYVVPAVDGFFEKFERIAETIDGDLIPAHRAYMKRQLHSLVLCSPFAYRTFQKPLGYAGDYEMVNMIARNPFEGSSLFAKVLNLWFLRQPPAEAHRNRLSYLRDRMVEETSRVAAAHGRARILSVGCGPAIEVQRFFEDRVSGFSDFSLLDFNDETLLHAGKRLSEIKSKYHRKSQIEFIRKSVHHLAKEPARGLAQEQTPTSYDFVYCAGLFDYLPDSVCKTLMTRFYSWLNPGGLLVATNVDTSNPLKHGMEHLLDWHLIYRDVHQAVLLHPSQSERHDCTVRTDPTGVNIFIEVRKPARPAHADHGPG